MVAQKWTLTDAFSEMASKKDGFPDVDYNKDAFSEVASKKLVSQKWPMLVSQRVAAERSTVRLEGHGGGVNDSFTHPAVLADSLRAGAKHNSPWHLATRQLIRIHTHNTRHNHHALQLFLLL